MVRAYKPTSEDKALTRFYRIYKGRKIDLRWSGGWLTPDGVYHAVDYKNGITHETLAEEHGNRIRDPALLPPVPR